MLSDLHLLPVYDNSEHDIIKELQIPLLYNSMTYLRGVGYFTSGWIKLVTTGLTDFIEHGGKINLIMSPHLQAKDWEAIKIGSQALFDCTLKQLLEANVADIANSLEYNTLVAFSWMIADRILDIKFAIPKDNEADRNYHDKVGIFSDGNGNFVAIHGSLNDSIQGSLNGEALSVFCSWINSQEAYCTSHRKRLEKLWAGNNTMFYAYTIPESIREQIINLKGTAQRPYKIKQCSSIHEVDIHLRPYQNNAVNSWLNNNCRGIFEMATGSGKTITSLSAALTKINSMGKGIIIILVPYLHLSDQWGEDCKLFGLTAIQCGSNIPNWQSTVRNAIIEFNAGVSNKVCIIAVHKTASTAEFQSSINKVNPSYTIIIADEVHCLGSKEFRKAMTEKITMRLGLSATPKRWLDNDGTQIIENYFGEPCYTYSLESAIQDDYLVHYLYHPIIVNMNDLEIQEYATLTKQISKLSNTINGLSFDNDLFKRLLIKRARVVANISDKRIKLIETIKNLQREIGAEELSDTIIYCAPGSHKDILKTVASLGVRSHEFVGYVTPTQRKSLLEQFAAGSLQALVAIKCLDEGVDVPSIKYAHIMASGQNPREFIQRRGRILRRSPGKTIAHIYDYIVMPDENHYFEGNIAESIIRREMPRFAEFASLSDNKYQAQDTIWHILDQYGLLNLMDQKPWEIRTDYNEERRVDLENE